MKEGGLRLAAGVLERLVYRRTIVAITLLFVAGIAVMAMYTLRLEAELVRTMAMNDAALYARAVDEFRTVYTSEVVDRVRDVGIEVRHDYYEQPGAIPLPATLGLLLGNRLTEQGQGTVRLYSDHPFPWRDSRLVDGAEGGVMDPFEREALVALRGNPNVPYVRFEQDGNGARVRYASADRMRQSCVQCHNSHPDSPKSDWKLDDVRGVLEVTQPLAPEAANVRTTLRGIITLLMGAAILALLLLALMAIRLRRQSIVSARLARDAQTAKETLQSEFEQRVSAQAEREKLQKQFERAQRLESVGVLAGGIAHDFNNLLMGISANTSITLKSMAPDAPDRIRLEQVTTAVQHATELTEQLLAYAGQGAFERTASDLSQVVESVRGLIESGTQPPLQVAFELDSGLPAILADAGQLRQLVLNLCSNAVASIDGAGRVSLRTGILIVDQAMASMRFAVGEVHTGPYVFLEVVDTGGGMSATTVNKMFDPFFTTKKGGRGLGLSAMHGILKSHEGALQVKTQPNHGTRMRCLFPVSGPPVEDTEVGSAPSQLGSQDKIRHILVVDDDEVVRSVTQDLLISVGFSVETVDGGRAAIERIGNREMPVDAVILDCRMSGLSGADTLWGLREIEPQLPIVLMSGYERRETLSRLLSEPNTVFLKKPFKLEDLHGAFQTLMWTPAPSTDASS